MNNIPQLLKRWSPSEFTRDNTGPNHDEPSTNIFIFTTPRTASYTLCRYFYAIGWGIPHEYFHESCIDELAPLILPENPPGFGLSIENYGRALLKYKVRNSVFAAKVMWPHYARFRSAFHHNNLFETAQKIYLRRDDFAGQVVSFIALQSSGIYSFDKTHLSKIRVQFLGGDQEIEKAGLYLIGLEKRWIREFNMRGWKPVVLKTEELVGQPQKVFDRLSSTFQLFLPQERLAAYAEIERHGAYEPMSDLKRELLDRHGKILQHLKNERESQITL